MGRAIAIAWVLLLAALPLAGTAGAAGPARDPVPVLAHYYIWFNPTSWNRAKTDYPLLGRYSSDDEAVMLRHILASNGGPLHSIGPACHRTTAPTTSRISSKAIPGPPPANVE